jgi:hypothetical protein
MSLDAYDLDATPYGPSSLTFVSNGLLCEAGMGDAVSNASPPLRDGLLELPSSINARNPATVDNNSDHIESEPPVTAELLSSSLAHSTVDARPLFTLNSPMDEGESQLPEYLPTQGLFGDL